MTDPLSVVASSLGIVEGIGKVIKTFEKFEPITGLENILGELTILQNIIAESVIMMKDLRNPPRNSATLAIARCEKFQRDIERSLKPLLNVSPEDNRELRYQFFQKDAIKETKVLCESFKSAVLLVRDIVTDSLTHEYLKDVRVMTLARQYPPEPDIDATNMNETNRGRNDTSSELGFTATSLPDGAQMRNGILTQRPQVTKPMQYVDPTQNLSLFDATISYIVDIADSEPNADLQGSNSPTCPCGRRRQGVWFPVRGKWDSGSNVEWISEDVIRRSNLEELVFEVPPQELRMFHQSFTFNRMITLNWQIKNEETSYTCDFWLANTTEFDLIIGEPWMMQHGYGSLETQPERRRSSFFGMLRLGRKSREQKKRELAKAESVRANASNKDEQRRKEEERRWDEYRRTNSTLVVNHAGSPSQTTNSANRIRNQAPISSPSTPSSTGASLSNSSQRTSISTSTHQTSTRSSSISTDQRTVTLEDHSNF